MLKFLNLKNEMERLRALVHVATSGFWAASFAHLANINKWWFLSAIIWILYVLFKEFCLDGHFSRLIHGTETKEEREDLVSDLFTNFFGLIFYGFYFL